MRCTLRAISGEVHFPLLHRFLSANPSRTPITKTRMIPTTRFSRRLLLIAIAASTGMFAQEMVSRISSAGDHPVATAGASHRSWLSAESYYREHPGVFRNDPPEPLAMPLTGSDEPAVAESPVEAAAAPTVIQPEEPPSPELVAVMAPNPFESLAGPPSDDAPTDMVVPEVVSAETSVDQPNTPDVGESSDSGESAFLDTNRFAMAAEAPAVERRPASIPDLEPGDVNVLPPPADRRPDLDGVDADVLLPPWQRRPAGSPSDFVDSTPARGPAPSVAAGASPDGMRYATPEQLVRERGIERGQQLQRRLEARRLLGYSPLRPPVQASPFTSGDPIRPVVVFVPRTVVVVQPESSASDR